MISSPIRIFYFYLISILGFLLITESGLEYRHYNRGYTTRIFGNKVENENLSLDDSLADTSSIKKLKNQHIKYGPTDKFPFKSKLIHQKQDDAIRIWIASASHAQGGRIPAKDVFPNLICSFAHLNKTCDVINGSKGGMIVKENIDLLNKHATFYQPDYAVLYQMSMIISGQQKILNGGEVIEDKSTSTGIINSEDLLKIFQSTSIYGHLSDFIGGYIKLSGPLKNSLPDKMDVDFENRILTFIEACRKINVSPVLVTFAASHDKKNINTMPFSKRTEFVKYGAYLSAEGWVNMVSHYNKLLKQIAIKKDVPLIELDRTLNGQQEFFIDFFHFNSQGHIKVATFIGRELKTIISQEEKYGGI
jgi:hypothetical protein